MSDSLLTRPKDIDLVRELERLLSQGDIRHWEIEKDGTRTCREYVVQCHRGYVYVLSRDTLTLALQANTFGRKEAHIENMADWYARNRM